MSASQAAAIAWRAERLALGDLAPCDRWYVHGGRGSGRWTACPPCYCSGEHEEAREKPIRRFATHAEAIAWATQQARAQTIPSTPRRKP